MQMMMTHQRGGDRLAGTYLPTRIPNFLPAKKARKQESKPSGRFWRLATRFALPHSIINVGEISFFFPAPLHQNLQLSHA